VDSSSAANFRKHIAYLSKSYTVVEPSNIKEAPANGANHVVAITFDDAFQSIMKNAVPVLKELSLPAGLCVPVGSLGQSPLWHIPADCPDQNETVMTEEQVRQLDRDGFEIFSHTVRHKRLTELEDADLRAELVTSKTTLERILNHEILGLSYPHGACDARVCEAAQRAGYKLGFTIEPQIVDVNTNCLQIPRFKVSARDSVLKFRLKISGAYWATGYLLSLKRKRSKQ